MTFNAKNIRKNFPVFDRTIDGNPFVYLDSGATAQKPQVVIDILNEFYSQNYGTVRRGVYKLSAKATQDCLDSRKVVAKFIGASSENEIIFCSGTTAAINMVAGTWGRKFLNPGDEVVITQIEHHANIVPWQILAEEKNIQLKVIPVNDLGELILEEADKLIGEKTKLLAFGHVSNALGTIHPVKKLVAMARKVAAKVLVDGAQGACHLPVNVQDLDVDFYAFSGHKAVGPTGIGVLYGKKEILDTMPPYQGGGDMIKTVSFSKTTYAEPPHRFEAGTPNIAGIIGLKYALEYLMGLGMGNIAEYEDSILKYGHEKLLEIEGLKIIGEAKNKGAIISFWLDDVHPHDIGTLLDMDGISVRAGHHCAQPTMERFQVPATTRASIAFYNCKEDIDALVKSLIKIKGMFS